MSLPTPTPAGHHILRRSEVEARTGFKRAHLYNLMREGKFPRALRLGIFGNFLAITRLPMVLASFIGSLAISKYMILTIIVIIYGILGCFMDALPMIMLTVPIFLPIITELGFDPIWFNVIIILVMQLGCITPPVGMSCYVVAGITRDIPLSTIFRGSVPFCFGLLVTIIIVTAWPGLATWLPGLMRG